MKRVHFLALIIILFSGLGTSSCSNDLEDAEELLNTADLNVETELEQGAFKAVNEFRGKKGLPLLNFNEVAYQVALEHTKEMAVHGKMSHDGFTGRSTKLAAQVNAVKVAENLSTNYPTAELTVYYWLQSPDHRAAILGEYTHTAVAVVSTPQGNVYYTQIFFKAGS